MVNGVCHARPLAYGVGMPRSERSLPADPFAVVSAIGRELPGVEAATRYDGSPVLKLDGCFLAGLATHASAEPGTLVARYELDERDALLADAPDTYYLTTYYEKYPLVLARLSRLDRDALRELLAISWRLTLPKTRRGTAPRRRPTL